MRRLRHIGPFLIGFLLATLAGVILRASPVMAQQAWSDLSIAKSSNTRPAVRPRQAQEITDNTAQTSQPLAEGNQASNTATAVLRKNITTSVPKTSASSETSPPADGEPDTLQFNASADGQINVIEAVQSAEGREIALTDQSPPEERAAFFGPPAGYDALAFQIELDPANDARPARLAALDPYAPVGHRAGSWVLYPTVEAGVGRSSNVYRNAAQKPDVILDVRPTLLAVTDWERHAVQLKATGLATAYGQFGSENERSYGFEARGRYDLSKRANIEVLAAHSLDQEPRSSLFSPQDARSPVPFITDKAAIAYNQRFNRLSLQLRGAVTDISYQPVGTYAGGTLSNAERDLSSKDLAVRAAWSFNSGLALFAETALNSQQYRVTPADGIARDSTGDRLKAGVAFGSQSQIWRGEVAIGYGHQVARDGRLPNVEGLLIEANLGWKPTGLTSVLVKANTDFLTSTVPAQGGALQRVGGVEVRHAFQRQLIGIAGVSYQTADYQGIALTERTTTAELGFEYFASQSTTLLGRVQHTSLESTAAATVNTDAVRIGVRYRP